MRLSYRQLPTWIYCDKVTRCLPASKRRRVQQRAGECRTTPKLVIR
jgi:hypothetical protein